MKFTKVFNIKLTDQIFDARFHPNSDTGLLAATTIAGNVHIIESGAIKSKLRKHHKGSPIRKVRFTDGGHLVTIAKTVKVHDLNSNETTLTLKRTDGKPTTFYSVMPFGNNIISAGDDDGGVFFWDTRTPEEPIFSAYNCDQYISDIDGKYENRKLVVCTSGEGTLTAYDMRAQKMIEPQSELFEAGFQCVKLVNLNKKVVIGGEDGAVYVFNQNEWAHTSGKFNLGNDSQNRGRCSIDGLDMLPDESTFLVACSDGRMRALTLWPHQILNETIVCRRKPLESIHVNPNHDKHEVVVCGENYINVLEYNEKDEDEVESDAEGKFHSESSITTSSAASSEESDNDNAQKECATEQRSTKKLKTNTEDYLNVFK